MSFFWTLESVLSYRATILKVFKDMGRLTVNKVALSTKDVLLLLHKWSLIERDTKLQGELKAIIEQHQAKDLMSKSTPLLPLHLLAAPAAWLHLQQPACLSSCLSLSYSSRADRAQAWKWGPRFGFQPCCLGTFFAFG